MRAEWDSRTTDRVIGFSGTFGGWHGIDVLAAAIPAICARDARREVSADWRRHAQADCSTKPSRGTARRSRAEHGPRAAGGRRAAAGRVRHLSCRRTTATWSTASSSARRPSCSNTWRWAAASSAATSSNWAKCCRRRCEWPISRARCCGRPPSVPCCARRATSTSSSSAVVGLVERPEVAAALGRNARQAVLDRIPWRRHVENVIWRFRVGAACRADRAWPMRRGRASASRRRIADGRRVQGGSPEPVEPQPGRHSLREGRRSRTRSSGIRKSSRTATANTGRGCSSSWSSIGTRGEDVLEIGGGLGTDLSQFARHGARVTDLDLSAGHLEHARKISRCAV